MEFRVLGPMELRRGGIDVSIAGARRRALLAVLLLHRGQAVSVDRLASAVWDEDPPGQPRNAIQTAVARLRESLGAPSAISTRGAGYALDVDDDQVDAGRFEYLLDQAQQVNSPADAVEMLDEALGLWRGLPYGEFADSFAHAEALRLEEQRQIAVEVRAAANLAMGQTRAVVADLRAALEVHPLRERLVSLLMRALATQGRPVEALAIHRRYRTRLADETGLDPSPELADLEMQILRGELHGGVGPGEEPLADAGDADQRVGDATHLAPTVGRDEEVAWVRERLARPGLVTITGPGGVGKTRLAADVSVALERERQIEVIWVDLAPVTDPVSVVHVVAAAASVDTAAGQPVRDAIVAALAPAELLLVLDNCEHVLPAVADLVDLLRENCARLRLLTTSRERLALKGEQVRPLTPLPVTASSPGTTAPAVRLFRERALTAAPAMDLSDHLDDVIQLCRELDGLPLAIELAAARVGAMPLKDMLFALRHGRTDAVGTRHSADRRHHDLRTVVTWSYDRLDPAAQKLFERLSVFSGVFDAAEAHAICATDRESQATTTVRLGSLVDQSLLTGPAHGVSGYQMLNTVRHVAHGRLADSGEAETVSQRHATAVVGWVQQAHEASSRQDATHGHWVHSHLDEVREAHRWARTTNRVDVAANLSAALYRFAYWRLNAEVMHWAEEALALAGLDDQPTAPQVYASAAVAAWMHGDLATAEDRARQGTQMGAGRDDPARTYAYETLGDVATFQGHLEEAEQAFREQTRLARRSGDIDSEMMGLSSAAFTLAYRDRVDEALALAEDAACLAGEASLPARAFNRYLHAECLAAADPSRALNLADQAVELAATAEATFVEGVARVAAASLRARHGQAERSLGEFSELLHRWRRTGNWTQQWTTLRNLAEAFVRLQADRPAVTILAAATTASTATSPYGAEVDRLQAALAQARERLRPQAFDDAWGRGTSLTAQETVAFAFAMIKETADPTDAATSAPPPS